MVPQVGCAVSAACQIGEEKGGATYVKMTPPAGSTLCGVGTTTATILTARRMLSTRQRFHETFATSAAFINSLTPHARCPNSWPCAEWNTPLSLERHDGDDPSQFDHAIRRALSARGQLTGSVTT